MSTPSKSPVCRECGSSNTDKAPSGTVWCLSCEAMVQSDDASDYARLDAIVRNGVEVFVRVGEALREIRDRKLYRGEYQSFAEYCQSRHKISGRRAYQLITSSDVAKNVNHGSQLLPNLTSERQARELAKVEPAKQAETWQAANEAAEAAGSPVTAAMVATAADRRKVTDSIHAAVSRQNKRLATVASDLRAARKLVPTHLWSQWLREELDLSPRQAKKLMCAKLF